MRYSHRPDGSVLQVVPQSDPCSAGCTSIGSSTYGTVIILMFLFCRLYLNPIQHMRYSHHPDGSVLQVVPQSNTCSAGCTSTISLFCRLYLNLIPVLQVVPQSDPCSAGCTSILSLFCRSYLNPIPVLQVVPQSDPAHEVQSSS